MENNNQNQPEETKPEETIFTQDEFSMEGYDKHIRQARTAIFAAAGILLLSVIILSATAPYGYEYLWIDWCLWGVFIIGFILLGFWTKKKPYTAIICALILYGLLIAINAWLDPSSIIKGIIFKIIIIVALVKGLSDAKQAQQMQDQFGKQQ